MKMKAYENNWPKKKENRRLRQKARKQLINFQLFQLIQPIVIIPFSFQVYLYPIPLYLYR